MVAEIKNLKDGQDRIEVKLDKFIDSADNKYATKAEVKALRDYDLKQDKEIKWNKEKIIDILIKLAMVGATGASVTKLAGVW